MLMRRARSIPHFFRHHAWGKSVMAGLLLLMSLEAVSALVFWMMRLPEFPRPWSWVTVLQHGFWMPVVMAIALLIFVVSLGVCYGKTGIHRWYALVMAKCAAAFLVWLTITMLIWSFWTGQASVFYPWQVWWVLNATGVHSYEFYQWIVSALGAVAVLAVFLVFPLIYKSDHRDAQKSLGNAHFASAPEIKQAGFFSEDGFIVGKAWGSWLRASGFEHVLAFAPTGSGKTRSISIPNLLMFGDSAVVNDNKLTLFKHTSGYREKHMGHQCFLWALSWSEEDHVNTCRYNPLTLIPSNPHTRIKAIQRLAHIMMPDGKGEPIWYQASRKLFKALVLYVLDVENDAPKTFGEINRLIKTVSFDAWLFDILETTEHFDPEFYRNGYSYLQNHEKTRSGILETFSGYFELFDDPIIDAATSASDFDMTQLRKTKMTIYVGFSDDDMERLAPLLTIFWQQVISTLIAEIPDKKEEPYSVMLLMDEFSSLGRIERLRRALKLVREYRVRFILMVQYIAQTFEKYSHDEAKAFTNIKTKVIFAPDDIDDAEYISKLLGKKTEKIRTGSTNSGWSSASATASYHYQAVPLLRPEEIMRLKDGKEIILRSGHAPINAKQCIWYKETKLKSLMCGEAKVPEQVIGQVAFERPAKDEKTSVDKAKKAELALARELAKEQRAHERELEKMKVQTDVLASAVVKVVDCMKEGEK
jgi:type IV secretion system protein VirD4